MLTVQIPHSYRPMPGAMYFQELGVGKHGEMMDRNLTKERLNGHVASAHVVTNLRPWLPRPWEARKASEWLRDAPCNAVKCAEVMRKCAEVCRSDAEASGIVRNLLEACGSGVEASGSLRK